MIHTDVPPGTGTVTTAVPVVACRRWGALAVAGLLPAVLSLAALPLLPGPSLDPVSTPISDVAVAGWGQLLFALATGCLVLASLALAAGLRAIGVRHGSGMAALWWSWCGGLALVAAFPTDPAGAPLSLSGWVHRYSAGDALLALPALAQRVAAALRAHPHPRVRLSASPVAVLAATGWCCLAVFAACQLPTLLPGLPGMSVLRHGHDVLGLMQRVLVGVDLAVLLAIASAVVRGATVAGRTRGDRR